MRVSVDLIFNYLITGDTLSQVTLFKQPATTKILTGKARIAI